MQIDWSTFILEIINFLVLVWLLRRFLYQPVLKVLHQRRTQVAEKLNLAQQTETRAQQLKHEFEQQIAGWEQHQAEQRQALQNELQSAQNSALEQQQQALNEARARDHARQSHQQAQWQQNIELRALRQAARFASQLLSALTCPELEARLLALFIQQWQTLADNDLAGPRTALAEGGKIRVRSAFALGTCQRQQLQQALELRLGSELTLEFEQAPELLSGIEVAIGSWHLGANLNDELRFFAEATQPQDPSQQELPRHGG